ncbi:hypothetical protein [Natrinema versiforme]|uniref:Type I restriction enzyme R protein N-terminal domain-containing protein n=1 Tax=Natrinema versiforme JCM 10478 TaxID=1227496 RepID=L9Y8M6_9EURY|nr:hypothetical protein [Natrinema versiforme]ELY70022.1 hypothetical protein C489_03706 [Natrinema versiforme JCM 10478]
MPSPDLHPFVTRVGALVDASPPTTRRETRTLLVEPFLETLGWDCRADSCITDRSVDGTRLEYVPSIDSVPALFVAVEAYDDSLEEARANALRKAMAWTGVDRAIYTNGRQYLLLAGTTDIEYRALRLSELTDSEVTLADYSRETLGRGLEQHSRTHVARQLAVERPQLVDAIADRLAAATVQGDVYADEFESAADRFLDRLVVAFAEDDPERQEPASDVSVRFSESALTDDGPPTAAGNDAVPRSGSNGSPPSTGGTTVPDRDAAPTDREHAAGSSTDAGSGSDADADDLAGPEGNGEAPSAARDDGLEQSSAADAEPDANRGGDSRNGDDGTTAETDGEYVVRFFNDRGSIGAIGHSTADGALVETAEYLFERGLSGVHVPWSPDDADGTVLNAQPTHADGSPMAESAQLSNGLYLATAGDIDDRAARVEALAARAGFRVMLTGDWEET